MHTTGVRAYLRVKDSQNVVLHYYYYSHYLISDPLLASAQRSSRLPALVFANTD